MPVRPGLAHSVPFGEELAETRIQRLVVRIGASDFRKDAISV